ncbi:hypothetical protein ACJ73_02336 [Blastomyces percursus]|uniref:Uncharacterized protein n=1 Tax=Blastomyces percursus TaxID=1658174 RepID=A0A1J9QCU6_9EURO|nr:hypothetical protein ACJ73_02336 [Blastomyces percursus]
MSAGGSRPLEGKFTIITGGSRVNTSQLIAVTNAVPLPTCSTTTYTKKSTRAYNSCILIDFLKKGLEQPLPITWHRKAAPIFSTTSSTERTLQLCEELTKTNSIRCIKPLHQFIHQQLNHRHRINNAGIGGDKLFNDPVRGPINAGSGFFHHMYTVNVVAPLILTQAVAPYLPQDRSGRIVNLSSVSASLGFEGQSVYGGTKAAIEAMTRTWARELGDHATVNVINPGPVIGDMYWEAREDFWKVMQGSQDNTPSNRLAVDGGFVRTGAERLSEETQKVVREKMGRRRPAFTDEVAGWACCARRMGSGVLGAYLSSPIDEWLLGVEETWVN